MTDKQQERPVDFQALLDTLPLGIWKQRADGHLEYVNKAFCDATGIPEEKFLSVPHYKELYPPEVAVKCMASDERAYRSATPVVSLEHIPFVDGKVHLLEVTKLRLTDERNRVTGLIGFARDITEQVRIEEEVRRIKGYLEDAQTVANIGNWVYDIENENLWWSDQVFRIFDMDPEVEKASFGRFLDIVAPEDRELVKEVYFESVRNNTPYRLIHRIILKDESVRYVEQRARHTVDEDNKVIHSTGTVMDITDYEELQQIAFYDPLTGAANRRFFLEEARMVLLRSKRENSNFAVIFIDLNDFKLVNDDYGHEYGDNLLKCVVSLFHSCMREKDLLCRWGGDEFIILVSDLESIDESEKLIFRIMKSLKEPFEYKDLKTKIDLSVGLAYYPDHGLTIDELIKYADRAMYKSKRVQKI